MNNDDIKNINGVTSDKPVEKAEAPVSSESITAPVVEQTPASEPESEKHVANGITAEDNDKSAEKAFTDIFADDVPAAQAIDEPETVDVKRRPINKAQKEPSQLMYFVRISGVLTAICVAIAFLLSVVNGVTVDKIAENIAAEKAAAVMGIFTQADDVTALDGEYAAPVVAIYDVKQNGALVGQCVNVESSGFGGTIDMMVGISTDGTVAGVKIISMSETPGLGSKTNSTDFLQQYDSSQGSFTVGGNIDAVAGATISSKAVTAGVNAALSAVDSDALAKEAADIPAPPADDGESPEETIESNDEVTPPDVPDSETAEEMPQEETTANAADETSAVGETQEISTEETSE